MRNAGVLDNCPCLSHRREMGEGKAVADSILFSYIGLAKTIHKYVYAVYLRFL